MPRPGFGGDGGDGGDGGPPDFEQMRAMGEKRRARERAATEKMTALLTADQRKAVPALLAEADRMRVVGLPLELADSLHLSAAQKTKIAAVARAAQQKRDAARRGEREKAHGAMLAILTPAQQHAVSAFEQSHPRPRPGFGGPPPM